MFPDEQQEVETPILFINADGKLDAVNVEMIKAYVPEAAALNLESAARLAAERDTEGAESFLASFYDMAGAVITIQ